MIELTIKNLNDNFFQQAVGKIAHCNGFQPLAAFRISKVVKQIAQETIEARNLYKKALLDYMVSDEKGDLKKNEGGSGFILQTGKTQKEFDDKIEELMNAPVHIQWQKFKFDDLERVGLSPTEMLAIEPMIDESSFTSEKIAVVQNMSGTH